MAAGDPFQDNAPITQADVDAGRLKLRHSPPVANTPEEAVAILRAKVDEQRGNPPKFWQPWHDFALRLADLDFSLFGRSVMRPAWRELLKRNSNPYIVVNCAENAWKKSGLDVRRPTTTDERNQLKRVRDAATELKRAVEDAPLPASGIPLNATRPWGLLLGWKGDIQHFDEIAKDWHIPTALLVTDLMETIEQLIDQHIDDLPVRAIVRDESLRSNPRLTAFVRHLTWHMNFEFGEGMPSVAGRIATMLFKLPEILSKRQVEKKLKHQPDAFSASRAREFHNKFKAKR